MTVDRFINAVKGHAAAMDQASGRPRFGVVTSVDPSTYTARVAVQPEGVISGWLPILSPWIGAGWGLSCPPSPGDQVLLVWQEDDAEHGVIVGRAFSNTAQPPPAPAGELWLVHQSGSFLKLHNDGSIEGQAQNWKLAGNVTVTGTISATGDISDAHGSLQGLRARYDQHTHADPQGGRTDLPSPQD